MANNKISITERQALAGQRILMDNGIETDETGVVLQTMGYVMFDEEWEDIIEWDKEKIPYEDSIWE